MFSHSGINVGSRLDFEQLNRAVDATKMRFTDVIDKIYRFEEASEAFAYLWSGKHTGKIVIEME